MHISKQRIEAFSDGVIAIIITIMVLNIPVPDTFTLKSLIELSKNIFIYFVSFFIVASQWNKHRHLFDNIENISYMSIWRNLLFLFFLSLMPIFTKWVIQYPNEIIPIVGYNVLFMLVTISYHFVWLSLIKENENIKRNIKRLKSEGRFSGTRYSLMVVTLIVLFIFSFFYPRISQVFFIGMPVVFSVINIIFENPRYKSKSDKNI